MRGSRKAGLALVALLVGGAGCGAGTLERASRGIDLAFEATKATQSAFLDWKRGREAEIVAAATSLETGKAELAAFRSRCQGVVRAFGAAYVAIAAAASALAVGEAADVVSKVTAAARAVFAVKTAVASLEEG